MYQKVPKRTRLLVLCSVGFVAILLAILSLAVEDSREQPLANEIAFDIANHESLGSVEVSYLRKMGVVLNGFVESDEALSELQSIVSKHACEGDRIHLDIEVREVTSQQAGRRIRKDSEDPIDAPK